MGNPRPNELSEQAYQALISAGMDDDYISIMPPDRLEVYNARHESPTPIQRPIAPPETPTPTAPPIDIPILGTYPPSAPAVAQADWIDSQFFDSPEGREASRKAAERFNEIQFTPGGTPAPGMSLLQPSAVDQPSSRLQQPFVDQPESRFAVEATRTARGEIPAEGLAGLLGSLAPQTYATREQITQRKEREALANTLAIQHMRYLYPQLVRDQILEHPDFEPIKRDLLTGARHPSDLSYPTDERHPSVGGRLNVPLSDVTKKLGDALIPQEESRLGGIIEPPALYMGRMLSAPASAVVGAAEAALTDDDLSETIPQQIQRGESFTGAGGDVGTAAAEATGVEELKYAGYGLGFAADLYFHIIPGLGAAKTAATSATAGGRAAMAGGARAGAEAAATQVIGRVSPSRGISRLSVNPRLRGAVDRAYRFADSEWAPAPARDQITSLQTRTEASIAQQLKSAGIADADRIAAELIEEGRQARTLNLAPEARTAAQRRSAQAIAERSIVPDSEPVRLSPSTIATEATAERIISEYPTTPAGRLAEVIKADPARYLSTGENGHPRINVEAAANDAGLTNVDLMDYLETAARHRYRIAKEATTPSAAGPARLSTMFSGTGTIEGALPPGLTQSVDAVELVPEIMAQFNRVHGTSYVPRSAIDINVADIAAKDPDIFHASPVCKNFSAAKRSNPLSKADPLDRLSAEKVAEVIREVQPPIVSIENVPKYAETNLFKLITDQLTASGYRWSADIVDAVEYGGTSSRKRLILRAIRKDIGELPPKPEPTCAGDWYAQLEDLINAAPVERSPTPTPAPAAPAAPAVFRKKDYSLDDVSAKEAAAFLTKHHYAGGAGRQGKYIVGLRDSTGELKGVAWWNPPGGGANVKRWAARQFVDAQGNAIHPDEVINLSRLAISPDVPPNAASYLLQRSIKRIRANSQKRRKGGQRPYRVALTYADQREGHTGFIYRLTGWTYTGESAKHAKWIDPATGKQVSTQATKNRDNAAMYAAGYKKQQGMRKHRYVLPIDRGLKYTGKEIAPPTETPRTPAAPAAAPSIQFPPSGVGMLIGKPPAAPPAAQAAPVSVPIDPDLNSNLIELIRAGQTDQALELMEALNLSMRSVIMNASDIDLRGMAISAPGREADLTGANLSGFNLDEVKLWGANLSGANLSKATGAIDGRRVDLSNANLSGADLYVSEEMADGISRNSSFSDANLSGADLTGAILGDANLTGANLSGADLTGANLNGADLTGANLTGANLTGASLSDSPVAGELGAILGDANLTGANLSGADLSGALFPDHLGPANLSGIIFDESTKWPAGFKPPATSAPAAPAAPAAPPAAPSIQFPPSGVGMLIGKPPAAQAAPTSPPILDNVPTWEKSRLIHMADRGTIDLTKPILSMGGSTGRTVTAARSAGGAAPTLKSTPKEIPRIYLPNGTTKRVTPRMMARLMGLPDTFEVPTNAAKAKVVLGNGIHGAITENLLAPLYALAESKTPRIGQRIIDSTVERWQTQGMPLPQYNDSAVTNFNAYALTAGAKDLTAEAGTMTEKQLKRALTPRELRPGRIRSATDSLLDPSQQPNTPAVRDLIAELGDEFGAIGDRLVASAKARQRQDGTAPPVAFIESVLEDGYAGDLTRATHEAFYGLYGGFDSIGQTLLSATSQKILSRNPKQVRDAVRPLLVALKSYDGPDESIQALSSLINNMTRDVNGYGVGVLKLPDLAADISIGHLNAALDLPITATNLTPIFKPGTGMDLLGATYQQARVTRIIAETLTSKRLNAAGIGFNKANAAIQINDLAAALKGSPQDAAAIYDVALAQYLNGHFIRPNFLSIEEGTPALAALEAHPDGARLLTRYSREELLEAYLSAGYRLSLYNSASPARFTELKRFLDATLKDQIQPIAQLEEIGLREASRKISDLLNLQGVEDMLKRVSKPEDQRLGRLVGHLTDVFESATRGEVRQAADLAKATSGDMIADAIKGAGIGALRMGVNAQGGAARWVKGGLLGGRWAPNLVYMGMNVQTAPAIVLSTMNTKAAIAAALRMPEAVVNSALKTIGGSDALARFKWTGDTTKVINAAMGSADPLQVVATSPTGQIYRAAEVAELIPLITTRGQAELADNFLQDFRAWSDISERAARRSGAEAALTDLEQSKGRKLVRSYLGIDPATGALGQGLWNEVADTQDLTFRIGVLLDALNGGRPKSEAVRLANEALFDYSRMFEWEKNTIAKVVWFWSFRRENLRATLINLVEHPEKLRATYQATHALEGDQTVTPATKDYMMNRPFITMMEDPNINRRWAVYGASAPKLDAMAELIDYASAGALLLDGALYTLLGYEMIPALRTDIEAEQRLITTAGRLSEKTIQAIMEERSNPFWESALEVGLSIQLGDDGVKRVNTYLDPRFLAYMDLNPDNRDRFTTLFDIEEIEPKDQDPSRGYFQGSQWRLTNTPENIRNYNLFTTALTMVGIERTVRDYAPAYYAAVVASRDNPDTAPLQLVPRVTGNLPLDAALKGTGMTMTTQVKEIEEQKAANIKTIENAYRDQIPKGRRR